MRRRASNTMEVKKRNVDSVLSAFRELGSATKSDIAQATGLSLSTCSNIIRELLPSGEILEGGMEASQGGRPSRLYTYNSEYATAICIALLANKDETYIDYSLVDMQGSTKKKERVVKNDVHIEDIFELIDRTVKEYKDISVIGIGIPGMTFKNYINYCDIPSLECVDIGSLIEKRYGIPVYAENEMHLKAYGYYNKHPELYNNIFVVLNAPENYTYGMGTIIDNEVLEGVHNFAGEINYAPFLASRQDVIAAVKDDSSFIDVISKMIVTACCMINPGNMLLSGMRFKDELMDSIYERVDAMLPKEFQPGFIYQRDISEEYLAGLVEYTIDAALEKEHTLKR